MNASIVNATMEDLPFICTMFEEAIAFIKTNKYIGWNSYDKKFLESDIQQDLLYKLTEGKSIICIFSVCYQDPLIWRDMEKGDAIYLHRIVLNRKFAGLKVFQSILDWATITASAHNLDYIRMDTWADNEKIIEYYKTYGFRYVETYTTADSTDLPVQHRNLKVTLLEKNVKND